MKSVPFLHKVFNFCSQSLRICCQISQPSLVYTKLSFWQSVLRPNQTRLICEYWRTFENLYKLCTLLVLVHSVIRLSRFNNKTYVSKYVFEPLSLRQKKIDSNQQFLERDYKKKLKKNKENIKRTIFWYTWRA